MEARKPKGATAKYSKKQPATDELFAEAVELLQKDESFRALSKKIAEKSRNAFNRFPGFEGKLLLSILAAWACQALLDRNMHEAKPEKRINWAANTGKSKKAVKNLPKRIRAMADSIEKINKAPQFNLRGWIKDCKGGQGLRLRLGGLPHSMRTYADLLLFITKQWADYNKLRPSDRRVSRYNSELRLSAFVHSITGRPCDRLVTDLLAAAALACGKEYEWFPDAMTAARYKRNKTKDDPKLPKKDR